MDFRDYFYARPFCRMAHVSASIAHRKESYRLECGAEEPGLELFFAEAVDLAAGEFAGRH